jgi:putative aldouronate transport system permease protein
MEEKVTEREKKMHIPYVCTRILIVVYVLLLFFPGLNPANMIQKAGQAKISATSSLFTSGVSYSSVINGLDRAFTKGWLTEGHFMLLFASCLIVLIGVVLAAVGGCMSVGNLRMKTVGNRFLLGGAIAQTAGVAGITIAYNLISSTADSDKITYTFPIGIPLFAVLSVLILVCTVVLFLGVPKAPKGEKMEMESKYKLFLMLMPFLILVLAFSYLPLFSWRYAFYDYTAGGEIGSDNFVGLKWFKVLLQNPTYVTRLLNVLKNTLALSGLGILTSWVPMFFAIFLSEVKSTKFKRFVQTFTTVPNFISWVLVYAIAFAIFSTDGFVNTLINSFGGNASANYLQSTSHMWLKMLAWGMWKGVGWSAIIYISGIAGIDQQLYEAATVDGAGRFQKMRHITLPGLLPTYIVMLVMSIAGVLSNGMDQYLVFTNAMNKDIIEVLDLYVYNLGIGSGSIPLSTVVGMAKSIVSVVLLFVANSLSKLIRGNGVV